MIVVMQEIMPAVVIIASGGDDVPAEVVSFARAHALEEAVVMAHCALLSIERSLMRGVTFSRDEGCVSRGRVVLRYTFKSRVDEDTVARSFSLVSFKGFSFMREEA